MSYSQITIREIQTKFQVEVRPTHGIFEACPPHPISDLLRQTLAEHLTLALAVSTEKIRAELIVAPMLVELRRQMNRQISLFSGIEFSVAPEKGLSGVCDFLIARSAQQLSIEAPVVALVEAKKDDIKAGLPQCIAEMIAARIFNEQQQQPFRMIYGVVTTGSRWVFLRLEEQTAEIDLQEYNIETPEKILGILLRMVSEDPR